MKKNVVTMIMLLALGVGGTAIAGSRYPSPVYVDTIHRNAGGGYADARATPDSNTYVGCTLTITNEMNAYAICFASNAAYQSGMCYTENSGMLENVRAINTDSYVQFSWDASGHCTAISVTNGSSLAPKAP